MRGCTVNVNDRVEQLFYEAMDVESARRQQFLDSACDGDAAIRAEVEALIADATQGESLIGGAIGRLAGTFRPEPGAQVGPYKLIRPIGEGGMGVVYLAERADGQFQQQVAIKFVQGGNTLTARFFQERQILARLEHPGIARLIDGGVSDDGIPFMVMDYFAGQPITEYCAQHKASVEERMRLFREVCAAVEYAHRSLIIHRDLKPANILVNDEGALKLVDFGIAKLLDQAPAPALTAAGAHFFTPDYASPEQIRGEPVTTATDVYSLGAVLFELLSGGSPHRLSSYVPAEITQVVCIDPAPDLGLGNELDHIVRMALRKEPDRRYASVAQLSDDVRRFLEYHPVLAKPDSAVYRAGKFVQRNTAAVCAAAIAVVCLVGGLGVAAWQAKVARREATQAQRRFEQVRKLARTVLFDFDAKIRDLAGATEARELLAKTALEYMDSLYADAQQDLGLRRELAAAYERIADVQGEPGRPNLGQRQNAIAGYRKASQLWQGIAGREGFDPLALARVHLKSYDITATAEELEKGAETAERARIAQPDNEEAFNLSLRATLALGTRLSNRSEWDEALEKYRHALVLAEGWRSRHSGNAGVEAVASCLAYVANASLGKGDSAAALEALDAIIGTYTPLFKESPQNSRLARRVFKAYLLRGHALGNPNHFHLGRTREAIGSYERAIGIAEGLLAADPKNVLARGDAADAYAGLAVTIQDSAPRRAKAIFEKAVQESLAVFSGSRSTLSYANNAANNEIALARVQRILKQYDDALRNSREGLRKQRRIAELRPKQPGLRHNMIATLAFVAQVHLDVGNLPEARASIDEALSIVATVPRDGAFRGKAPSIAEAYAAAGRYHRATKSGEAQQWYAKGVALWSEIEQSGVSAAFVRPHKAAFLAELAAN